MAYTCTHSQYYTILAHHTKWQAKQIIDVISIESMRPGINTFKGTVSWCKGHELPFLKTFANLDIMRTQTQTYIRWYRDCVPQTTPIEIEQVSPTHPFMAGKPKKRRLHIKDWCKLAVLYHPCEVDLMLQYMYTPNWTGQALLHHKPHRPHTWLNIGDPHPAKNTLISWHNSFIVTML